MRDPNLDLPFCAGCPDHAECMQGACYLLGGPVIPPNHQRLHDEAMENVTDKINRSSPNFVWALVLLALIGLVLLIGRAVFESLNVLEEVRNACHSSTTSA